MPFLDKHAGICKEHYDLSIAQDYLQHVRSAMHATHEFVFRKNLLFTASVVLKELPNALQYQALGKGSQPNPTDENTNANELNNTWMLRFKSELTAFRNVSKTFAQNHILLYLNFHYSPDTGRIPGMGVLSEKEKIVQKRHPNRFEGSKTGIYQSQSGEHQLIRSKLPVRKKSSEQSVFHFKRRLPGEKHDRFDPTYINKDRNNMALRN